MHAMQYKIQLPNDYDMTIIRERIQSNGHKTDGFQDLKIKAYLIQDEPLQKAYSPLYVWEHMDGMNHFIFDGFYDNILKSFGWQHINIGIPMYVHLDQVMKAKYVLEIDHVIDQTSTLKRPEMTSDIDPNVGYIGVYNPDKWHFVEFYFLEEMNDAQRALGYVYELLHVSL